MVKTEPDIPFNRQTNLQSPCYNCQLRKPACWSECVSYKRFKVSYGKQQADLTKHKKQGFDYETQLISLNPKFF